MAERRSAERLLGDGSVHLMKQHMDLLSHYNALVQSSESGQPLSRNSTMVEDTSVGRYAMDEQLRKHTADKEVQVTVGFRELTNQLHEIWDHLYMAPHKRETRIDRLARLCKELFDDVIVAEEGMANGIVARVEKLHTAVQTFRRELSMDAFDGSAHPPNSIPLLRALESEHDRLTAQRDQILASQTEAFRRLHTVCTRLGKAVPSFEAANEKIMPKTELDAMARACSEAEQLLAQRLAVVQALQTNITKMAERMGTKGVVSAEELRLAGVDFSAEQTVVSTAAVQQLESIHSKMEAAWIEWEMDVQFRYDELSGRLDELYEKCAVPEGERLLVPHFDAEAHGEELLSLLRQKAEELEERYARGRAVLDRFVAWQQLWLEKILYDETPTDYRSADLAKRLRRKTDLDTLIPRALKALVAAARQHLMGEADARETDIHVGGMRADHYAHSIVEQYEAEQRERRLAKKTQPAAGRKNNADLSMRQLNRKSHTIRKRLDFELSAIAPTRDLTAGALRTSSPKTITGTPRSAPLLSFAGTPGRFRGRHSTKPTTPRAPWK